MIQLIKELSKLIQIFYVIKTFKVNFIFYFNFQS